MRINSFVDASLGRNLMRNGLLIIALLMMTGLAGAASPAQDEGYRGIWISTPFPSFNATAGETVTLDLTVHNAGLPPQRVVLELQQLPKGWSAVFLGGGKRVQSVFVAPDDKASVKLRLETPNNMSARSQHLDVFAIGEGSRFRLPVELTFGQSLPPKLTLKPELPELRGSPTSDFEFKLAIRNDGGDDATVRVDAAPPKGFRVKITEQYGSQELTSLPLEVGKEKTVSLKITPPFGVKQGKYPVDVRAVSGKTETHARLTMEVSGEPQLDVKGLDERLSASAEAGVETPIEIVVSNRGSAPVHNVKFDTTAPSGWKVKFEPERIDGLAPDATRSIKALVEPSKKAIAGDYMLTVRAEGDGMSKSSDFRVTVQTSTLWGVAGVLVIAAALVVLVAAMLRYGRR